MEKEQNIQTIYGSVVSTDLLGKEFRREVYDNGRKFMEKVRVLTVGQDPKIQIISRQQIGGNQ